MKTLFNILERRRPPLIGFFSVVLIGATCAGVFITNNVVDIKAFLIIPVLLSSWYGSKKSGAFMSVLACLSFVSATLSLGLNPHEMRSILFDTAILFLVLLIVATIVTDFRKVHRLEVTAAETDFLTGACSSRKFYAELANEILRSKRYGHIFSIAYLDVDNFKMINDKLGHTAGDKLLIEVSRCLRTTLRETDIISRIGGDEFACILPESEQEQVISALKKAEIALKAAMKKYSWNVSFSVGVVTFRNLPDDVNEAVKIADNLMYEVKRDKKNDIAYRVWNS